MMYSNYMAAAIRVDGKTLKEKGGEVLLPFGSEYSVFLKNINSVKAKAKVFIDGEEVTNGWLVLNPNETIDLERFIQKMDKGNKFKFIERTEKIEEDRGIKADDGLVRVEFKFAKKVVEAPEIHRYPVYEPYYVPAPKPYYWPYWEYPYTITCSAQGAQTSTAGTWTNSADNQQTLTRSVQPMAAQNMMCNATSLTESSDAGITVKGSESTQKFQTVSDFSTESQTHVIVLKLKGFVGDKKVEQPITAQTKIQCENCGTTGKVGAKFCSECGTSLVLY